MSQHMLQFCLERSTLELTLIKLTWLLGLAWSLHLALAYGNSMWRIQLWRLTILGLPLVALWPLLPIAPTVGAVHVTGPTVLDSSEPTPSRRPSAEPIAESYDDYQDDRPRNQSQIAEAADGTEQFSTTPDSAKDDRLTTSQPGSNTLLAWLWGIGVLLLAARRWRSHRVSRTLVNSSAGPPATIQTLATEVTHELSVHRQVDFRVTDRVNSPFTCGLWRPVIVLPKQLISDESEPTLRAVLAHEISHVRGRDYAWSLGAHAIATLLWFHPLCWRLVAAHRASCEAVADATAVRHAGLSGYLGVLARVALRMHHQQVPQLAMVQTAEISTRIAQLRRGVPLAPLRRPARLLAGAAGVCILTATSGLHVVEAQPNQPPDDAGQAAKQTDSHPDPTQAEEAPDEPKYERKLLLVRFVDADGRPVPNVKVTPVSVEFVSDVTILGDDRAYRYVSELRSDIDGPPVTTTSGSQGYAAVAYMQLGQGHEPVAITFDTAFAGRYSRHKHSLSENPPITVLSKPALDKGVRRREAPSGKEMEATTVQVINPEGEPVKGAVLQLWSMRDDRGSYRWSEEKWGPKQSVTTNADGVAAVLYPRYLKELCRTEQLTFEVRHPDYCPETKAYVAVGKKSRPIVLRRGVTLEVTAFATDADERLNRIYGSLSDGSYRDWKEVTADRLISMPIPPERKWLRVVHVTENDELSFSRPIRWFDSAIGGRARLHVQVHPGTRVVGRLDDSVPRPVINGRVIAGVIDGLASDDAPETAPRKELEWTEFADIEADGTFIFASLPRGDRVEIIANCDGFVSQTPFPDTRVQGHQINGAGHRRVPSPQLFELVGERIAPVVLMEPTATCDVKVVDETDTPVEGARVVFYPCRVYSGGIQVLGAGYSTSGFVKARLDDPDVDPRKFWTPAPDYSAVTGADGIAVVNNLPRSDHQSSLFIEHPDYELPIRRSGSRWEIRIATVTLRSGETTNVTLQVQKKGTEFLGEQVAPSDDD